MGEDGNCPEGEVIMANEQLISTMLEELDKATRAGYDEARKTRAELFKEEKGPAEPSAARVYSVEVTYDGGDFIADLNFVLRPEGGGAPVLRITTTSIVSPVKGKWTRHGKAILHYEPSAIINWRVWADTAFERLNAHGTWGGL